MAARKCSLCNLRNVGTGTGWDSAQARVMGYCNPCLTSAEWENVHSDYGHEGANTGETDHMGYKLSECWVCCPDLDASQADHTPRTGHTNTVAKTRTSHAGHAHATTPQDRAICRRTMATTGNPYDVRKA